jgi:IS5 family transposase
MRRLFQEQLPLVPTAIDHAHARELQQMSAVLGQLLDTVKLIHADLMRRASKSIDPTKGRDGMTAEQVLRVILVKQMNGFSYEELAFHLADSSTYRAFCRFGIDEKPLSKSALQKNIKRVSAKTWEAINRRVVVYANAMGVETGKKVRTDCTVVESNIHIPTDSSLLWDGVRVLVRLLREGEQEYGLHFIDHSRRAKRRAVGLLNAKSNEQRLPLYRDLLHVSETTVRLAERMANDIDAKNGHGQSEAASPSRVATELRHYIGLVHRVISQTKRRVLQGEAVPAPEKVVSIFEPHTDIIVKDRREPLYGHKICLTGGASGLITDVVIERGNPADATLAVTMVERQRELYGKAPRQVSMDGGFTSKANLEAIKKLGVEDVAFSKHGSLAITDMVKSSWVFQRLRNFRAGIEGTISFLKRGFGLGRCTWRGLESFKAYVFGSVLACNLLVVARHLLSASG